MDVRQRSVPVWGGRLDLHCLVGGAGPSLLYLHPAAGLHWDPFLERLAETHTVHAPFVPGTAPGDHEAISRVDDLWDLVLIYEEAIRGLGLERGPAIGSSFGGMLACELAAHAPDLFSRLVLLDPIGLWRADLPVQNGLMVAPEEQAGLLFFEPDGDAARASLAPPEDPDAAAAAIASVVWALGCTSKFFWPVPDRGLAKRMHRITAPTLVVWGREDRLVPAGYAEEFAARIADSRVELIDACGHLPQAEQPEQTLALVREFLAGDAGRP